jgi:arsenical pump membrane protein
MSGSGGAAAGADRLTVDEAIALVVLAASLTAAVVRLRWAPDWAVAAGGAALLVAVSVLPLHAAGSALSQLGPTVGFLAALLVLADGCRAAGVFDALGQAMARGARGSPRRLLAMVFLAASVTTAVLSLDATIVLLTPIVFTTAARLMSNPRPHVYACSHLANTASLLLPVSNLTNLLAFHASGLSFTRFGALMALPWLIALAIEWVVLSRSFASDLGRPRRPAQREDAAEPIALPRFALAVLGVTLGGFAASSALSIAPVWIATAGALVLTAGTRRRPLEIGRAAEPTFLVFVLALGIVVSGAGRHGLSSVIDDVLPHSTSLPALLAVAGISAVLANLVNNLPATLIILPAVTIAGPGAVLAMLMGVNVGPNSHMWDRWRRCCGGASCMPMTTTLTSPNSPCWDCALFRRCSSARRSRCGWGCR